MEEWRNEGHGEKEESGGNGVVLKRRGGRGGRRDVFDEARKRA